MTDLNSTLLAREPFVRHTAYTLWRLDENPAGPQHKPVKVPVHHDGITKHSLGRPARRDRPAVPPNPAPPLTADLARQWLTYHRSVGALHARAGEVGYIGAGFRPEGTGLVCVDLDGCVVNGQWTPGALALFARFPGALIESSVSGQGAHIWFTATGVGRRPKQVTDLGDIEVYGSGQFIACGTVLSGDASVDHTAAVAALLAEFWPETVSSKAAGTEWDQVPEADRARVIDELRSALPACDQSTYHEWTARGMALATLGDDDGLPLWHELSALHPDYDEDAAEQKWFQLSPTRTGYQAIFAHAEGRGWVNPRKRQPLPDDATSVFSTAVAALPAGAVLVRPEPVVQVTATGLAVRSDGFASLADQDRMFAGCTYVASLHRVMLPNGSMLKPEAFNAMMGGYLYTITADGSKSTRKAFEAFTENQVLPFPRVEGTAFKPQLPFGAVVEHKGRTAVNTYRAMGITPVAGDASPWLRLLERQYPDPRDRAILTAYMAACLRHPGRKWQWAVLLQGVQGSAKTLHSRVLQAGLGEEYVHELDPKKIGNQFNAFMRGRLLVTIEEINIPGNRHDLIDALKPLITNHRIEIEAKGVDAVTEDVCANFFLFTNRPDGLPASRSERRFAMLHMAQQEVEDLARDGLTEDYFRQLYDWLNGGGYAVVVHHLLTCEIDARFDPAGAAVRAPETSSTEHAIRESMGREEQFINEAIENGEAGFAGGWVSSIKAAELLTQKLGREPAPKLLGTIIRRMGYRPHPALTDGRTNGPIMPDNKKTRLYVKPGTPIYAITDYRDVTAAYSEAQPRMFGTYGGDETPYLPVGAKTVIQ